MLHNVRRNGGSLPMLWTPGCAHCFIHILIIAVHFSKTIWNIFYIWLVSLLALFDSYFIQSERLILHTSSLNLYWATMHLHVINKHKTFFLFGKFQKGLPPHPLSHFGDSFRLWHVTAMWRGTISVQALLSTLLCNLWTQIAIVYSHCQAM